MAIDSHTADVLSFENDSMDQYEMIGGDWDGMISLLNATFLVRWPFQMAMRNA